MKFLPLDRVSFVHDLTNPYRATSLTKLGSPVDTDVRRRVRYKSTGKHKERRRVYKAELTKITAVVVCVRLVGA